MRFDPRDISYLRGGTDRQKAAHQCLTELRIFEKLAQYTPVLVSTVCLNIDTPTSDLDIICEAHDLDAFEREVAAHYGTLRGFNSRRSSTVSVACVVQFFTPTFEIEVYGEPQPVERQNGYRHFLQFRRVIELGGENLRERLQTLKRAGIKSEPALATLLGLSGDPYRAVLDLEGVPDVELAATIREICPP